MNSDSDIIPEEEKRYPDPDDDISNTIQSIINSDELTEKIQELQI